MSQNKSMGVIGVYVTRFEHCARSPAPRKHRLGPRKGNLREVWFVPLTSSEGVELIQKMRVLRVQQTIIMDV